MACIGGKDWKATFGVKALDSVVVTGLWDFFGMFVGLALRVIGSAQLSGWLALPLGRWRGITLVPSTIGTAAVLTTLIHVLLDSDSFWGTGNSSIFGIGVF